MYPRVFGRFANWLWTSSPMIVAVSKLTLIMLSFQLLGFSSVLFGNFTLLGFQSCFVRLGDLLHLFLREFFNP